MKQEVILRTFDDERFERKLDIMSPLEAAFDDMRNEIPEAFLDLIQEMPLGVRFRLTIEVLDGEQG